MTKKKSGWLGAVLGFALVTLTAAQGSATTTMSTIPGFAGRALNNTQLSCFAPSGYSAMSCSCAGPVLLMIPAQYNFRTTGTTTFSAEAPFPSGGSCNIQPSCNAIVTDTANGFINQTNLQTVCGNTVLGLFSVPSGGVLHFECSMGPGMTINSVSFSAPSV